MLSAQATVVAVALVLKLLLGTTGTIAVVLVVVGVAACWPGQCPWRLVSARSATRAYN